LHAAALGFVTSSSHLKSCSDAPRADGKTSRALHELSDVSHKIKGVLYFQVEVSVCIA